MSSRMPLQVQKELLDTVFGRKKVIYIGHVQLCVAAYVNYSITDDRLFFLFPVYLTIALVIRLVVFDRYTKARQFLATRADFALWERRYTASSVAAVLGAGLMAGYSAYFHPDTLATSVNVGVVFASMLTVIGRNFGLLANVRYMSLACCLPMTVAFCARAAVDLQFHYAVVGLLSGTVIVTSMELASYLNGLLHKAHSAARRSEISSNRFNLAISSMPNGLVLVDGEGRVVVANAAAMEQLGVGDIDRGDFVSALEPRFSAADRALLAAALRSAPLTGERLRIRSKAGKWIEFQFKSTGLTEAAIFEDSAPAMSDGAAVVIVEDVTVRVRADQELEHLARYDGLTKLANRRYWEERTSAVAACMVPGDLIALAVLDVDRFKLINDTLGHHVGDMVIAGVADRLRSVGDPRMFCGRLGGDEFVILVERLESTSEAVALFDDAFRRISTTYEIEGHNVEVRCSGGAIVRGHGEFNLHADMSRADMALYKVKRKPQPWLLFDRDLEGEFIKAAGIKNDLKAAIADGSLKVVYQPIFDPKGDRFISAEALCRWEHPEVGFIPPSEFIGMAEEIGMIGKLTEYVLGQACRDCAAWEGDFGVSVNLSAIDLSRDDIVDVIRRALAAASMPPAKLCIEVTETVFVKDYAKTAVVLQSLRDMGVKVSLDDFGTGYSSLSYMHKLPLDRVKIDASFVASITEDAKSEQLFRAVVSLAKQLDYEVVVEGVETRTQLACVLEVPGVDLIQGHVFSKGVSSADIAERKVA